MAGKDNNTEAWADKLAAALNSEINNASAQEIEKAPDAAKFKEEIKTDEIIQSPADKAEYKLQRGKLPLSISVETQCGLSEKLAEIGDSLPLKKAYVFSTGSDIPETVALRLYAGERPFASDNLLISEVKLDGIEKLLDGRPVISLVLGIDMDCNISIEATDEGSLNNATAEIDSSWVPASDEVLRIVKEAQSNFNEDSVKQNKVTIVQIARESLCKFELKYKKIRKGLPADKAASYGKKLKSLKSKLKKIDPLEMSELTEKSIIASINELNVTIGAV